MSETLTLTPDLQERASQASYSSLTLHRTCAQAWLYRYGYRLEEDKESSPYRTLGSWWSILRAAESLERGRTAGTLKFVPEKLVYGSGEHALEFLGETVTVERVLSALDSQWSRSSSDEQDEFISTLGEPLPNRIRSMFALWDRANPERAQLEHPIGVEVYVERELPNTEADGQPPIKVVGYLDELYLDVPRKMVVIRDHKTSKTITYAASALDDLMDSQLQLYAWMLGPLMSSYSLPTPRAVAYDRTRSVAPKTPTLTQTGTLSKSTSDYDLMTYLRWCEEDTTTPAVAAYLEEHPDLPDEIREAMSELPKGQLWGKLGEFYVSGAKAGQSKFGVYEKDSKVTDALRAPDELVKWHSRTLRPVQKNVVASHLRAAVDSAQSIRRSVERAEKAGEASRNITRRGCQFCDYASLCRAQIIGGPDGEYDLESLGLRIRPERSPSK